ncbi:hypothetical protein GYMLUDRAFT_47683 [Collybiopsis luxurians FD-317 M1]|uniref:Cyanovirin-N domain-containing protein n=1 Tax=Collybiopsis luxurians FD-317 M1 TaxID=944289 RepID=A0A0D0BL74_9AGAR|nr:hypothetical protein GYMLUDRAFT_47683 [Collybiopsis luxurians FD-317 M1]
MATFDRTYINPHLVNNYLTVKYAGKNVALDLDTCLSISNGKLVWGGRGGFSALRNQTLTGSDLTGQVEFRSKWVEVHLDLSTNIMVKDGRLIYVSISPPSPGVVFAPVSPSADPPPSYEASFAQEFRAYKSSNRRMTDSERSSSFFKFSVGSSLALVGSVLHARCRKAGERDLSPSQLDLDRFIGLIDGRLVWGHQGFYSLCRNVKLEGYSLYAESARDSKNRVTSTLDLSRYLYVYNGALGIKVDAGKANLSTFLTEAPWLKFKVVTESNSDAVLGTVGEQATFKTAFSSLAEATSKHIVAEMQQEYFASAAEYLKDAMNNAVGTQSTEVVANAIRAKGEDVAKVREAYKVSQEAVITACQELVHEAANEVVVKYTESVVGPMQDQIIKVFDAYMQSTLAGVSASAIAQFQERAEILMEKELVGASVRRAQTQAHLLNMLAVTLEEFAY